VNGEWAIALSDGLPPSQLSRLMKAQPAPPFDCEVLGNKQSRGYFPNKEP